MTLRQLAALAASAALAAALAGPSAAGAATTPPYGAPGIGDSYFPHDGNGGIDVRRYDVHDRYDFDGRLSGRTTLTLRATQTLSGFSLDFLLPVRAVVVDGVEVTYSRRGQDGHELLVDQPVDEGSVHRVVVHYAGRPGARSYAGERNWLADRHEVVAMNEPHMAPWWFPSNDHPRDKALMRVSITVPRAKTVVANGRRVGRVVHGRTATTTWQADEPMATYLAFFAAGPFRVARGTSDGLPWYVAVSRQLPPDTQARMMRLMRQTPRVVQWLETQLGDYPFDTTGGVVTSLDPGFALENQTRPTYEYWTTKTTVVHELAHQWFGDDVSVDGWRDVWLNEGFASFMEVRYQESRGWPADRWLRNEYDAYAAGDPFWKHEVADPCPELTSCAQRIFAGWVYDRGAMTLQALRNRIGDDDFWALLHAWVAQHAGGNGTTAEFEQLAEDTSGEDLGSFFDAWLHSPTRPADTAENGLG